MVVEQITLGNPQPEDVLGWEDESIEYFQNSANWLGTPDCSAESYILYSNHPIEAEHMSRIEPLVSDAQILMAFRDVDIETWNNYLRDDSFREKRQSISQEMTGEGLMDIEAYLSRVHQKAPEKVVDRYFSADADLESLRPNFDVAKTLEEIIESSRDFALAGVDFTANSRAGDPIRAYDDLEEQLFLSMNFKYGGNQEAVENYNRLMGPWVESTKAAGVPGSVIIGDGRPYLFLPDNSNINLSYSEVENRFNRERPGIIQTREDIQKEEM